MAHTMRVPATTPMSLSSRGFQSNSFRAFKASALAPGVIRARPRAKAPLVVTASTAGDAELRRRPNRNLEIATSGLASISRLPFGVKCGVTDMGGTQILRKKGAKTLPNLKLYEFEACPFCRRVREAITDLDLNVEVYPAPRDSVHHRAEVRSMGGKEMFPYLVDEVTGTRMYESEDIVNYLYEKYGGGLAPNPYLFKSTLLTGWMPILFRPGRGALRDAAALPKRPAKLLKLYNYDGNQFARLVREVLCELEIPYLCVSRRLSVKGVGRAMASCGKGSMKREDLRDLSGATTVPYIIDPNTGVQMSDSEKIIEYLYSTYSTAKFAPSA